MVNTIFFCLYCELVKTNSLTGPRFSADFHRLSTKQVFFNTFAGAFCKKPDIGVQKESCQEEYFENSVDVSGREYLKK